MLRSLLLIFLFVPAAVFAADIDFTNLDGIPKKIPENGMKATVIFFTDIACPEANQYMGRMNEIYRKYSSLGIGFLAVYSQGLEPWTVSRHVNDRDFTLPVAIDFEGALQKKFAPKTYSEVVVVDPNLKVLYQGRIDDQFGLQRRKDKAENEELVNVLEDVISGKIPSVAGQPAEGCPIDSVDRDCTKSATYFKNIKPLIEKKCLLCHADGGIGYIPLSTYENIRAKANAVKKSLVQFQMPPWLTDVDPDILSTPKQLTKTERDLLLCWLEAGLPRGVGQDKPVPQKRWRLGTPDKIISAGDPVQMPATGPGEIHRFEVNLKNNKDLWIENIEIQAEDARAVHHLLMFTQPRDTPMPTILNPHNLKYLAGYGPGFVNGIYPAGYAHRLPAHHKIVAEIHLAPTGKSFLAHPKIALYFSRAKKPIEIHTDMVDSYQFNIPKGVRFFRLKAEKVLDHDVDIVTTVPHAHYRSRAVRFSAELPDGSQKEIISVPRYSILWQPVYGFKKPIKVPKGSRLSCEFLYDNSSANPINPNPNVDVGYGEDAQNEMLACYFDSL